MAYVNVPKDLSKIKTKLALNLTKRQLFCFGGAALFGIPIYFFTRSQIGNSAAMLIMITVMLPCFFMAMYERDGLPFERVARNIILLRYVRPARRPYKTENFYGILNKEGLNDRPKEAQKTKKNRRPGNSATDNPVPSNEA